MDFSFPWGPVEDPILVFGLCMVVILLAPVLFRRMRVPGIMGLIAAGVVVGPNGVGLLERGETVVLLGTAGLLYIMFMAGLEISISQFSRYRNRSIVFGALTFSIPQVTGTLIFRAMGFDWPAAILIASMFASHTLVAYPVASALGIGRNPAVTTAVGGTILTDTVALLVLAVVARSVQGELDLSFWMTLGILFSAYVAGIVLLLPMLARWFFRNVQDGGAAEFAFVLAVTFICSWLARVVGTEPIIGAFIVGLTLNRLIPRDGPLMNRINFFGESFLIPFFLIYIGMLVDISVLTGSVTAWIVMGTMLATNMVTKWVASMVTRRIYGFSRAQGWVMFGLSTAEAAATLAATLVGYELGIIGDEVLNGVILMIFVTCMAAPWIVQRFGVQVAREQKDDPMDVSDLPERILVPLARPASGEQLLEVAFALRPDSNEDATYALFAVPEGSPRLIADGETMLGHAVRYASAAEIPLIPLTRVDSSVASAIARATLEERISTIVVGWSGKRSGSARVFGSVLDQLLEQTRAGLWVSRLTRPLATHGRLLLVVPPDGTLEPGFPEAIRLLRRLQRAVGFTFTMAAVSESDLPALRELGGRNDPQDEELLTVPAGASIEVWLASVARPSDLVVLFGARENRVSWNPDGADLPGRVAERLDWASLITLYPGEPLGEPAVPVEVPGR
ncbi:MAG: cation:proton antiporter [Gemmatimonadales bacterium]|nr:MAG: cation:proton antiporter [Gemmatimonadales bacterium]